MKGGKNLKIEQLKMERICDEKKNYKKKIHQNLHMMKYSRTYSVLLYFLGNPSDLSVKQNSFLSFCVSQVIVDTFLQLQYCHSLYNY